MVNLKNIKKGKELRKHLTSEMSEAGSKEYNPEKEIRKYHVPYHYHVEEISVDESTSHGWSKPFAIKNQNGEIIRTYDTDERAKAWAKFYNRYNKYTEPTGY